jgi:hypothetical protein
MHARRRASRKSKPTPSELARRCEETPGQKHSQPIQAGERPPAAGGGARGVEGPDLPDPEWGRAIASGVDDSAAHRGWVSVGTDHDTAEFAVVGRRAVEVGIEFAFLKGCSD